ncbi:hypothetical protein, partial [Vibrio vulnificus]|uniref:hypothetical protein n=1 Tax=Vibrio vulnificus TaxID=672 RepID=UPI00405845E3
RYDSGGSVSTNKVEYFSKEDYKKITSWFDELGYRINPSRFQSVLDTIADLPKEKHDAKDIWALCELDDLYRVYKSFSEVTNINSGFKDTLKKVIGGSVYLEDEPRNSSSENSRDFIFELLMGSQFANNKIIPHFGVDTETEADLKVSLPDGTEIHAECKRIKSKNKIRKHTRKALSQAQKRGTPSDVGVIFVSISHLVWELLDRQLLCSKVEDVDSYIFEKAESLIKEIQSYYNYSEFGKTVALITHYKLPFIDFDTNDILYFNKFHTNLRYWEEHMQPPYNNDFRKRGVVAIHLPRWIK